MFVRNSFAIKNLSVKVKVKIIMMWFMFIAGEMTLKA